MGRGDPLSIAAMLANPPNTWLEMKEALTEAAFLSARLVIELFEGDYTCLGIGMKVHLLPVFDTFTFPSTIVGFKFGNLRIARLENLLDYLLRGHPVRPRLIGPCWV